MSLFENCSTPPTPTHTRRSMQLGDLEASDVIPTTHVAWITWTPGDPQASIGPKWPCHGLLVPILTSNVPT